MPVGLFRSAPRGVLLFITAASVGLLLFGGARLAFAHGGDPSKVHACAVKGSGWLRLIPASGSCTFLETPLDWNQTGPPGPAGEIRGLQEYTSSGSFNVPPDVTRILVELVGAGGAGGGDGNPGGGGGGGGAGGYARGVLPVTPGSTCTITVGVGGAAPLSKGNGGDGGQSTVACGASSTATAQGGKGGSWGPSTPADVGQGGDGGGLTLSPGLGGQFVVRPGEGGDDNLVEVSPGVFLPGVGGDGGRANPISMPFVGLARGDGGKGGPPDIDLSDTDGKPGQPGWVLIQW